MASVLDGVVKAADLLPGVSLQPHQRRLEDRYKDHPGKVLLMHGLGTGKTLTSLGIAESQGTPYTSFVPASLRNNLRGEQAKFTDGRVPSDVMSYSALARGRPVANPDSLVMDEVQGLRNPNSLASQRAMDLADRAKQVTLLSGTPIVNDPSDLAVPMSMVTGKRITPREFTDKYVGTRKVSPGFFGWLGGVQPTEEPAVRNEDELRALLKGHVDYYQPDRPTVPTTHEEVPVEMSADQAHLYHGMWGKLPWMLRWKLHHSYPLTSEELQRSTSFLSGPRQVGLSTYPYMGHKADALKAFQGSPKLQTAFGRLQDTLKDDRTKALIFSNFIDAGLTPYSAGLTKAGIPHGVFHGGLDDAQRKKLVEDYNTGKIRVALLGPAGAEGLSFKGTQLVQLLDPHWQNARGRQSEGRALRYDAHLGLDEDLRNVKVQRYVSKLPLGVLDRMASGVGFNRDKNRRAADDYLMSMAARKDRLNQRFIDVLKDVGTPKQASSPAGLDRILKTSSVLDGLGARDDTPRGRGALLAVLGGADPGAPAAHHPDLRAAA